MTQPNLSELAKKGDPRAIATKMNQLLQPRGITATTEVLPGQCLQVVLESAQVLNRQVLATFVQRGLERLGVQTFHSVKLVGRQTGLSEPVWTQDIIMSVPPAVESFAPVTDKTTDKPVEPNLSSSDTSDTIVSGVPRAVIPPPPPLNRGVGAIAPLESTSGAAALHDFHDNRLPDSSLASDEIYSGADLANYAPVPGAYRPFGASEDADDAFVAASVPSLDSMANQAKPDDSGRVDSGTSDEYDADHYTSSGEYGDDYDVMPTGTHALHYPDDLLDEPDEYGDDYDVMPTGTHALHYPDDLLNEPDEYGDDYDVMPTGTHALHYPDDLLNEPDEYGDDYDEGFVIDPIDPSTVDTSTVDHFSEGAEPEPDSVPYPDSDPYRDEPDLAELRGSIPPEEEYSPIPWTALIVSLVATWVVGLVGYALWSATANRSAPQPQAANSAAPIAPSPQPSPPIATASPANPTAQSSPAAQSPSAPVNPALQFTPGTQPTASASASPLAQAAQSPAPASPTQPSQSPQAEPQQSLSPQASATPTNVSTAALAPPAIACRPVPFGANSRPVELSNLGFDTSVADADGHYVVGCITNHSDQPIAKLTIAFQGQSTQNQAVSQNSSTDLTFSNLRPRQAVPFRSVYTVNPDINTMTINSISWTSVGATQPRQAQVSFPLRR